MVFGFDCFLLHRWVQAPYGCGWCHLLAGAYIFRTSLIGAKVVKLCGFSLVWGGKCSFWGLFFAVKGGKERKKLLSDKIVAKKLVQLLESQYLCRRKGKLKTKLD